MPDATTQVPAPPARVDAAGTGAAYVVQVAAFSDHYGASSLATKLKRSGFPGYTEAVTTAKGTMLHRVRVGPYVSREAADAASGQAQSGGIQRHGRPRRMTAFDFMVIGVVGLSTVLAFMRGFVRGLRVPCGVGPG